MDGLLQILQIASQIGGLLALLVAPYLYFENRKLRRLGARKNKKIAQEQLEQLERNEESIFEEKMNSLPVVYGKPFEVEGYDTAKTQWQIDTIVRRRENYFNDASKIKAIIEEQEEIENMSTFRGLFGLKPKNNVGYSLFVSKRTLKARIRDNLRRFFF